MSAYKFQEMWLQLATPESGQHLEASEAASGSGIWIARDYANQCHLLIEVAGGIDVPQSTTKGLMVYVGRHSIPGRGETYCIDLICLEEAALKVFFSVAAELEDELNNVPLERKSNVVVDTLTRWRWFWDSPGQPLSHKDALGLFAELWFLDQWVGVDRDNVFAWGGGEGTRHDFQWAEYSVEVKAATRPASGAIVHVVQHLDQLGEAETGQLYLFSLVVTRDRLAENTLTSLVSRCSGQLRDVVDAREYFLRMVSRRGYNPTDRSLESASYRIIDEGIYEVAGEFPRLTAESFPLGIPTGVTDISYKLDMATCESWRRDRRELEWLTD